jgi:polygalacturonase
MIQHSVNVKDCGALADGQTLNTSAIARAIEACAQAGGGRVTFPAGTYLTGPIRLQSRVELHVEAGAVVEFSRNFDDYPLIVTHYEGQQTVRCQSPLWGQELSDVAITGQGTFDGGGEAWRPVKKMKLAAQPWAELCAKGGVVDESRGIWWPSSQAMQGEALVRQMSASGGEPRIEDYLAARDFLRPNLLQLIECQNVTLDGPTFQNSPAWNVHLLLCENVEVRNCTILNPWFAQNGDGLDIESCRDVRVHDCTLDVGDDGICLKSGKDAEGRRRGRPCEDITITDCRVLHGHGGIVVGSEMSGGVKNVRVERCDFRGTDVGLRFKTCRGRGGVVENIVIRDITMHDITGAAISFDMFYGGTAWSEGTAPPTHLQPVSDATPVFRGVSIQEVSCEGAKVAIEMRGLPEMPIEGISISRMTARTHWGVQLQDAHNISLHDVQIEVEHLPALKAHNVEELTLVDFVGRMRAEPAAQAHQQPYTNGHNGNAS